MKSPHAHHAFAASSNAAIGPHGAKLPPAVRIVFGLLAAIGSVFTLAAWAMVPAPIGIFLPAYDYFLADAVMATAGSLLALMGYFVWTSWLLIAVLGRSLLKTEWPTQLISLINHADWLVLFPFIRHEYIWEMLATHPHLSAWLVFNVIIAALSLVMMRNLDWDV